MRGEGGGGEEGASSEGVWTTNLLFEYMRMEAVDLIVDKASVSSASIQKRTNTSLSIYLDLDLKTNKEIDLDLF